MRDYFVRLFVNYMTTGILTQEEIEEAVKSHRQSFEAMLDQWEKEDATR